MPFWQAGKDVDAAAELSVVVVEVMVLELRTAELEISAEEDVETMTTEVPLLVVAVVTGMEVVKREDAELAPVEEARLVNVELESKLLKAGANPNEALRIQSEEDRTYSTTFRSTPWDT